MMQTPPAEGSRPGSPQDWLKHARSDLALARVARSSSEDVLPEQSCFHAQQAAEKALKAVLIHRQVDFPRVHDLQTLIELAVQAGVRIPDGVDDAVLLNPYAVEYRYPGHGEEIGAPDVSEAIEVASVVVAWAEKETASAV